MPDSLGSKAAKGAVWATVDRFGMMILQFSVNLILARILMPEDFGIIGMLAIFIVVSQVLIDGGFSSALIQKKSPSQTDYSTILFWNIGFSFFIYIILFFSAPFIADFYEMKQLTSVLRGIGISLILNAIFAVQKVRLQKDLAFRTLALTDISSYLFGGGVAVFLALRGFGVWSLVIMPILIALLSIMITGVITKWLPSLSFSKKALKELFGFGGFLMASTVLQTICQNLQGLIIGKKFSATIMGFFSQAYKLDQITSYSIPQVIVQVMFPVYSSLQDDTQRLNQVVLMNLRVVTFIVYPLIATLIIVAEPLITILYGVKWIPSVPYFRVLCVGGFFVCLQNINFYAVAAVGKSKILFKWSFYKWGFLLTALLVGMNIGIYGILWGIVASNINIFIVNACLASKYTGLKIAAQIKAMLPVLGTIAIASAITSAVFLMNWNFIICIIFLLSSFFLLAMTFKLQALYETLSIIKRIVKRP